MPRPATSRPPGEHLASLARMVRQIDADTRMSEQRRLSVKTLLMKAMNELQRELLEGKKTPRKRRKARQAATAGA